jgi:hypothetical protein
MSFDVSIPVRCRTPWRRSTVDCATRVFRFDYPVHLRRSSRFSAVTARIHGSLAGVGTITATARIGDLHPDRAATRSWWSTMRRAPRVGAFVGEVHATSEGARVCGRHQWIGSRRAVWPRPPFSSSPRPAVSTRTCIVEFGQPVTVGGLRASGDVMFGDGHGLSRFRRRSSRCARSEGGCRGRT